MSDHLINAKELPRLLDAKQLADSLAVPVTWVWAQCRTGRIPYFKLGKYYRFSLEAVLASLPGSDMQSLFELSDNVVHLKQPENPSQDTRKLSA